MSEKSEQKKKFENAWKTDDVEKLVMVLKEHSELLRNFKIELTEIKAKPPSYLMPKDLRFSLSGSIPIGLVLAFLQSLPVFQNLLGLLSLGVIFIVVTTLYSSLISLKPFNHRSLNPPLLISFFSMMIASLTYGILSKNAMQNIVITTSVSWILGLFPGGIAFFLNRWVIGVPKFNEPYKVALVTKSDLKEFLRVLLDIFDVHSFRLRKPKKIPLVSDSFFAKFRTTETRREGRIKTYDVAVDCRRQENKTVMKMFVYRVTNDAIMIDDFCELLAESLITSLRSKVEIAPYEVNNYKELFDFSLGYTHSKLEGWIRRNYTKVKVLTTVGLYSLFSLPFGLLVYINWDQIIQYIGPTVSGLKEYGWIFSLITTIVGILTFLFGPNIYERARKRLRG